MQAVIVKSFTYLQVCTLLLQIRILVHERMVASEIASYINNICNWCVLDTACMASLGQRGRLFWRHTFPGRLKLLCRDFHVEIFVRFCVISAWAAAI